MPASLKVALFSLLLLVSVCSGHISSEVYQIKSSSDDSCPRKPCLTLSQFINKSDSYIVDNTTLIFQPGNHSLESVLSVSNISMLSLHGTSNTVIMCHGSGRFELSNIPFINPLRMRKRVTVVRLSVCLSVCVSVSALVA